MLTIMVRYYVYYYKDNACTESCFVVTGAAALVTGNLI